MLTMLNMIRQYLMLLMVSRRNACERWHGHKVGPRIRGILEKNKEGQWCLTRSAGCNKFEVTHQSGRQFVVNLQDRTCSYRSYDLNGIPCPHACAAISKFHGNLEAYVDDCYKIEAYSKTYNHMIEPMRQCQARISGLRVV